MKQVIYLILIKRITERKKTIFREIMIENNKKKIFNIIIENIFKLSNF